ncbi:hypothetical protein KY325_01115 [Candidatus Woesearchaeota archaeon]|nr:hypothetical protein [Candidatus Woesearchaeota archaeon]MBW3017739.1 hypothetical protein [Candidatus Woesearchaeota archaeon]
MVNARAATHYFAFEGLHKFFRGVSARRDIRLMVRDLKVEHKEIVSYLKKAKKADLKGVDRESHKFMKRAEQFMRAFLSLFDIENKMAQEELETIGEFEDAQAQLAKVGCPESELDRESEQLVRVLSLFKQAMHEQRELCAFFEDQAGTVIDNSKNVSRLAKKAA